MKLPLEIIGIIVHFYKTEHVNDMLKKAAGLHSLGTGIKILSCQKNDPHEFAVKECQGEREHE
jgi:hypothetical protein